MYATIFIDLYVYINDSINEEHYKTIEIHNSLKYSESIDEAILNLIGQTKKPNFIYKIAYIKVSGIKNEDDEVELYKLNLKEIGARYNIKFLCYKSIWTDLETCIY